MICQKQVIPNNFQKLNKSVEKEYESKTNNLYIDYHKKEAQNLNCHPHLLQWTDIERKVLIKRKKYNNNNIIIIFLNK